MLSLINNSALSHLEFHRAWLFSLYTRGIEWGNADKLGSLFSNSHDQFSQRELTLGLAKSRQEYWFRTQKTSISEFPPWLKRAFLAGASACHKMNADTGSIFWNLNWMIWKKQL